MGPGIECPLLLKVDQATPYLYHLIGMGRNLYLGLYGLCSLS